MNVCLHLDSNAVNFISQQPDGDLACEHAHRRDGNTRRVGD